MAISDEVVPYTVAGKHAGMRLLGFPLGSDAMLPSHKTWLKEGFLPDIQKHPGARVTVLGMTSRVGPEKAAGLSQRRADQVTSFIRSNGQVNIVDSRGVGDQDAVADNLPDGKDEPRYRAVTLRWEGLNRDIKSFENLGPKSLVKRTIKTQPGIWLVTSVDTFGLPIKISPGKITITLLNDKGEQWAISGIGLGVGHGVEFGAKEAKGYIEEAVKFIKGIGFKLGDVPNLADGLKDLMTNLPTTSATTGGIFRKDQIVSNWSIEKIVARKSMVVISGGMGVGVVSGELGLLYFDVPLLSSHDEPFGADTPWGLYSGIAAAKLAAEIGVMFYAITDHKMIGIMEKEVVDVGS